MSSIVSLSCCFQKVTPHVFPPFVFLWCALLSRGVPDPLLTVFCCCWEVKHTDKGCALCFLQSRIWPAMGKIGKALEGIQHFFISFAAACHFTFLGTAEREGTSSVGILAGQHRVGGPESFLSTYTLAHTHTHRAWRHRIFIPVFFGLTSALHSTTQHSYGPIMPSALLQKIHINRDQRVQVGYSYHAAS